MGTPTILKLLLNVKVSINAHADKNLNILENKLKQYNNFLCNNRIS